MENKEPLFSEREGYKEARVLHPDEMPDSLRKSLWNAVERFLSRGIEEIIEGYPSPIITMAPQVFEVYLRKIPQVIWREFFKEIVEEGPRKKRVDWVKKIKDSFFALEWYEIYDLIEFIIRKDREDCLWHLLCAENTPYREKARSFEAQIVLDDWTMAEILSFREGFADLLDIQITGFQEEVERIFKRERAPYKIINGFVTPLISEIEVEEVERALAHKDEWAPVSEHIKKALELFRKRPEPDYLNSIKEAHLALETLAKIKTGKEKEKVTLGQLASQVVERLSIHPALQEALRTMLDKLHGWASREHGIRHSEGSTPPISGEAEARLMLVISSALVNYFIAKDC